MTKKVFLPILVCLLFFLTRLQNLTSIPIFGDEAIYLRWSQIIKAVETLRFIPLTDGKQPLFMWLVIPFLKFVNDPLFAGRLVSVFSGFGVMFTAALTSTVLVNFNEKIKEPLKFLASSFNKYFYLFLFVSFLYIFLPFTFFFDRLATPDNLLSFLGCLSLLLSLLLSKFKRLDLSLLLGATLGISWITKSPAIYFICLSVGTFFVFNFKKIASYIYPCISSTIALIIYNLLRLGPQFHMISLRNRDYVWSFYNILQHPLDPLMPHLSDIKTIMFSYISPPVLIVFFTALILCILNKKINKTYLIVGLWCLLPLIANAIFAKVFTARYILFILPPFLIFFASITYILFTKQKFLLLLFLFLFPNIFWLYNISTNPFNQKLPSTENGYLSDWTSGWGIKEAADFLISQSTTKNVIVGTEGYFGTLPDGLQIYTNNVSQLTVFGVGLGFNKIPEKLIDAKNHGDDVYLLINNSRINLLEEELSKLTIVAKYPKPENDSLILFRI